MPYVNRRVVLVLVLIILTALCTITIQPIKGGSSTIVVPDDYPTISSAIGNATDGDTIFVRKGTYEGPRNQTLVINKMISLIGEDANNTKINLHPDWVTTTIFTQTFSYYAHSVKIEANDVNLGGFTITSDGGEIFANGDKVQIMGNIITTRLILNGSYQTFAYNVLTANIDSTGTYGSITANNVVNGIIGVSGSYNSVFANNVVGNYSGIGTGGEGGSNLIYANTVKDGDGISIGSSDNIVANNTITNSSMGVGIYWGQLNIVYGNTITNCPGIGLYKTESHGGNVFYANYVANNSCGAKIAYAAPSDNTDLYHNNFVNNVQQVNCDETETVGSGEYSFTRPLYHTGRFDNGSVGNYWSDYKGIDADHNGIGDTPYIIDANRADHYPLMTPFDISSITIQLPEWANISSPNPLPIPSVSPRPSPSVTVQPEPFPTTLIAASVASVAVVGLGLLVYFRKRNR
jgi:nitrous oxidase accessory protein NosD